MSFNCAPIPEAKRTYVSGDSLLRLVDQPYRIRLSSLLPHLPEMFDSMQTLAKAMERVDQCDDF